MKSLRSAHIVFWCVTSLLLLGSCSREGGVEADARHAEGGPLGSLPGATDVSDVPSSPSGTDIKEIKFDDPEFPLRRTIKGLLESYAGSCEDRDIGAYDQCLHDDFKFVFVPEDAESLGLPPDEPWWDKPHDLAAMGNMFEAADVVNIRFGFVIVPGRSARDPASAAAGVRIEPDIIVTIERPGEEPLAYRVNDSYLDLTLVRDSDNLWVIDRMEEVVKGPGVASSIGVVDPAVASTTFGQVKAMYR
jgi:hypothetical protein